MKIELAQIQELRNMIPIGMMDARELLERNQGNLEKSRTEFIASEIQKLSASTGEESEIIAKYFFEADYDINIAQDKIEAYIFDKEFKLKNYQSVRHDLNMTEAWLLTIQSHGFLNSLQTADFESIVLVVKECGLVDFSVKLEEAYNYMAEKEESFRELDEEKLIEAVENLKNSKYYQDLLEEFRVNIMLNMSFAKNYEGLRRNIL